MPTPKHEQLSGQTAAPNNHGIRDRFEQHVYSGLALMQAAPNKWSMYNRLTSENRVAHRGLGAIPTPLMRQIRRRPLPQARSDMNQQEREVRQLFMPIAVVEHHVLPLSSLSTYDLAERLGSVWQELQMAAHSGAINLRSDCILGVNSRIARAFDAEPGTFKNEDNWPQFVEACGNIEEAPTQVLSWIFSALYWNRLTSFKLSTAWLYTNALRVHIGLPALYLTVDRLGPFMESLSGSGPPLYDGQSFYLEDYAHPV